MDITRYSILISDWLYSFCSQRWRSSTQSAKTRPGADFGSDHELLIAKFRLKFNNIGKAFDYAKSFECVNHNKLWKILKEMVIPDHFTCLMQNLYAGQEATVRTGHGTMDSFKIGKWACSLIAQLVKNLPAMWETWVRSLGREDPLEKGKITHSSILTWRIPWTV